MGFLFSISSTDIFRDSFIASWIYTILDGGTPLRSSSELNFPWNFYFLHEFFQWPISLNTCQIGNSAKSWILLQIELVPVSPIFFWILFSLESSILHQETQCLQYSYPDPCLQEQFLLWVWPHFLLLCLFIFSFCWSLGACGVFLDFP